MKHKIQSGTIVRTIVLALALINHLLVTAGHSPIPFDEPAMEQWFAWAFDAVAGIWAWWKNNSVTQPAIAGDMRKDELKRIK